MRKIIFRDERHIPPFNEEARDLNIQNKPLWLHQRDILIRYPGPEIECGGFDFIPPDAAETLVYRNNLYFDQEYLDAFITAARKTGGPGRAAIAADNKTFKQHALPLSTSYTPEGNLYLADLWYFPKGIDLSQPPQPIVIDFLTQEMGYYHVPAYFGTEKREVTYQAPQRGLIAIDSWVHVLMADMVYGIWGRGARFEARLNGNVGYNLKVLWHALLEQRQILECSELVRIGKNSLIDPSVIIHGPTAIGDNCHIDAGVVIENCTIGNNVNISQGCQLMLSTVGDGSFLPFRAALFETTLMENVLVAQNTCLQMCVIGRNTFMGAGNTFTDYNLLPSPIRAANANNALEDAGAVALGGCVGHNCRIGAGMIVYPARMIESDVILFASKDRRVIDKNVAYEDSDHLRTRMGHLHKRLYPRKGEKLVESW